MRKRIAFGLAGSGIFLAGLLAGMIFSGALPVFASNSKADTPRASTPTSGANAYCQLYEQQLAKDLGVTTAKLEQANQDAAQKTIDKMYADGKITAYEKSQLEQKLQQLKSNPCQALSKGKLATGSAAQGGLSSLASSARPALEKAVADKLGITSTTLQANLAAGQTIPQIAQAHHVTIADVNAAYLAQVQAMLAQAVSGGFITQDQSTMAYQAIQRSVTNGHYPLLEQKGRHA
ncbi:MAG: hypothetical protein ACXWQ5_17660 [Ktedonobacterales bacterium]